jgi:hypothetical protein
VGIFIDISTKLDFIMIWEGHGFSRAASSPDQQNRSPRRKAGLFV